MLLLVTLLLSSAGCWMVYRLNSLEKELDEIHDWLADLDAKSHRNHKH